MLISFLYKLYIKVNKFLCAVNKIYIIKSFYNIICTTELNLHVQGRKKYSIRIKKHIMWKCLTKIEKNDYVVLTTQQNIINITNITSRRNKIYIGIETHKSVRRLLLFLHDVVLTFNEIYCQHTSSTIISSRGNTGLRPSC